eukprot:5746951-Alexandrium_andersonii.AAC.1
MSVYTVVVMIMRLHAPVCVRTWAELLATFLQEWHACACTCVGVCMLVKAEVDTHICGCPEARDCAQVT